MLRRPLLAAVDRNVRNIYERKLTGRKQDSFGGRERVAIRRPVRGRKLADPSGLREPASITGTVNSRRYPQRHSGACPFVDE